MSSGWTAPGAAHSGASEPGPEEPSAHRTPSQPTTSDPLERELVQRTPLFPLRPLGVGELLGAAVRIYRMRPGLTLKLSALVFGIAFFITTIATGLGMIPMIGEMQAVLESPEAPVDVSPADAVSGTMSSIASSAVSALLTLVATSIVMLALAVITVAEATGEPIDRARITQAIRTGWWRALLATVIAYLIGLLAFAAIIALAAIPLMIQQEGTWLTVGSLLIGLLIGAVLWLYIYVRFALAIPIIALEETGVIGSLRRSLELTRGRRLWRVLGTYLLVIVLGAVATQVVSGVFLTIATVIYIGILLATSFQALAVAVGVLTVISMLGTYVATVLIAPFLGAGTTAVYADARMRHEAWDIELTHRAQAARATASGQAT